MCNRGDISLPLKFSLTQGYALNIIKYQNKYRFQYREKGSADYDCHKADEFKGKLKKLS